MADLNYSDLSVLIVDDVRSVRLIIRSLLRTVGIQNATEAGDGEEALELLAQQPFDLIIADLTMQPMDGIEMTRRLRKEDSGLNAFAPILMVSAHNDKAKMQEAAAAGVTAFLQKPIMPSAVAAKLKDILRNPDLPIRSKVYFGPDRRRRAAKVVRCRRRPPV